MEILLTSLSHILLGVGVANAYFGGGKYIFTTPPNYKRLILEEVALFGAAALVFFVRYIMR